MRFAIPAFFALPTAALAHSGHGASPQALHFLVDHYALVALAVVAVAGIAAYRSFK
ncbi:MAG: hypothetical protein ACPGNV_09660 [Mangrovicoccus sp.]